MSKGRVVALMSGGVDSSVSAALLKQQGYEVIGVYILGWLGEKDFPCDWQKEEADARAVASGLNIPFYTINLSEQYRRFVVDDFFAGYQKGETPNPDVLCNREIKFKALWWEVRQFEPDYLATGHYARIKSKSQIPNPKIAEGGIFKAKDDNKDQTYFLWGIDRAMLSKILFPLGELTKPEVRALARQLKLPTAEKKDSQGVCFVGDLKVKEFLRSRLEAKEGEAVLASGKAIAKHRGLPFYTIGERLRAGSLNLPNGEGSDPPALYVLAKDIKNNRLIVGSDRDTYADSAKIRQLNWLAQVEGSDFECLAKIRYRQIDVEAKIHLENGTAIVKFGEAVRAVTKGQSAVFYSYSRRDADFDIAYPNVHDGQLLGGGIIDEVPAQEDLVSNLPPV